MYTEQFNFIPKEKFQIALVSFVDICTKFTEDIDLCIGAYVIDAKSILGVLCLVGSFNSKYTLNFMGEAENLIKLKTALNKICVFNNRKS